MKKILQSLLLISLLLLIVPSSIAFAEETTDTEILEPDGSDLDDAPEDPHTTYTVSADAGNKEIQKALNKAKKLEEGQSITVIVPAGTHILTKRLLIYSNTTLHLEDGAVMEAHFTEDSNGKNGTTGSMLYSSHVDETGAVCGLSKCPHTDYNRTTNIIVEGGIWDRCSNIDRGSVTGIISLRYSSNTIVRNTTLCNATEHLMNVSVTKDVLIENVTFKDQFVYSDKSDKEFWGSYTTKERYAFCEALHVDYLQPNDENGDTASYYVGCENVTVKNCLFENVYSGIGTHHKRSAKTTGITITGNTFLNVSGRCVDAFGYENMIITNNTYLLDSPNKTSYFVYAYKGNGVLSGNTVSGCRSFLHSQYGSNYVLQSNTIENTGWHGVYLYKSSGITISQNTLNNIKKAAVYIGYDSSATVSNNSCATTGTSFVLVTSSSSVNAYSNQCSSLGTYGFYIGSSSLGTISGNTVRYTGESGICLKTTERKSLIQNNQIEYAGTYAIEILSSGNKCQLLNNTATNPGKCDIFIDAAKKYTSSGNIYYFTHKNIKYKVIKANKNVAAVGILDKNVKTLTVPANVKSGDYTYKITVIEEKAFRNCKKLKEITIGKNVKKIKEKAFRGCSKLKKITIKCTALKTVESKAFGGAHQKVKVYVKPAKLQKYSLFFDQNVIRKSRKIKAL